MSRVKNISVDRMRELEELKDKFIRDNNIVDSMTRHLIFNIKGKLGFDVIETNLIDGLEGMILVDENGVTKNDGHRIKFICVEKNLSYSKKRFTIAHELAHYIIEDDKNLVAHREHNSNRNNVIAEDEADYLAASMLMPLDEIKDFIINKENLTYNDYAMLSNRYKVDMEVVLAREKEVRMLNEYI